MYHFVATMSASLASGMHAAPLGDMWAQVHRGTAAAGDLSSVPVPTDKSPESLALLRRQVDAVKNTTECEIRMLAYEYALTQLPERAAATNMVEVFDGLELEHMCGVDRPKQEPMPPPSYPLPATAFFVDAAKGSDANPGTEAAPFQTVAAAVGATRLGDAANNANGTSARASTVVLRAGTHFLGKTLALGAADSGLTLMNYPAEEAWLSGGVPLTTAWTKTGAADANIFVTDVTDAAALAASFTGLMTLQTHRRLTRARFPNALPEDRHTVKNLGGRDGLTGYLAPEVKPAAEQVWVNLTAPTKSKTGIVVPPYNGSILEPYKVGGRALTAL